MTEATRQHYRLATGQGIKAPTPSKAAPSKSGGSTPASSKKK